MRLENILALTYGILTNEPSVNIFENIVLEAKRINRGDLFIAFDEDDIQEAVLNGAYGVVYQNSAHISDNEIAWIKVDNLNQALIKLLRFRLIEKDVVVYETNEIVVELALQVWTDDKFIALSGDIKSIIKTLWNVQSGTTILFCPALCESDIFTNVKTLPKTAVEPITIMEQTLFETSFIYDNVFYERQLISPFFIPFLEELLHLYKYLKIDFKLKKFTSIKHFEAVFTNKNFEPKEFGTSDKVLIFEKNTSFVEPEILFLQKQANWAKIIYVIPFNTLDKIDEKENVITYKNEKEIVGILKGNKFHFALIIGVDKSILSKPLTNQRQLTLDF